MRPIIALLPTLALAAPVPKRLPVIDPVSGYDVTAFWLGNLVGHPVYEGSKHPAKQLADWDLDPEGTKATESTKEPDSSDRNPYPHKPSQPDGFYGPYWTGYGFPGGKVPKGYPTEDDWWHFQANVKSGALPKDASFHDYFVARLKGDFGKVDEHGNALVEETPADPKPEEAKSKDTKRGEA